MCGAFAIAGCGSSSTVVTNPSPVKCQVTISLNQNTVDASGGEGKVTVATTPECTWTASTNASWIGAFAPASGQGSGEVTFQVAANATPNPRSGQISLNSAIAVLTQSGAPCQIDLSPASQTFNSTGGSGQVTVTAIAGCAWTAVSNAPWLIVNTGTPGNGSGTVGFSVGGNNGAARAGAISIGGQAFVVTQQGPAMPSCMYSIQPGSKAVTAAGESIAVAVTADPGCSWTATSNVPWLAVTGVGAGTGNGSVTITAQANTGNARNGTATIAGQIFAVTQDGSCAITLNPPSQTVSAAGGGATPVSVATAANCTWTATTPDTWITLGTTSGTGNGSVSFTVAATTGPSRLGSIVVGGATHAVTQSSGCTFSINPTSQTFTQDAATSGPIAVTTGAGCGWTATTAESWITITRGATGSGPGSVEFNVAANSGAARTGTVTIAGLAFTVTQGGTEPWDALRR